jgi:CheY-like chemotaxis protein
MAEKKTILWVENDPMYIRPYVEALKDEGFNVLVEKTVGAAKRTILEEPNIDLALLDVMIPLSETEDDQDPSETDNGYRAGVALGRWIREHKPNLPFIGLSVRVDSEIENWFREYGAGFITKFALRDVKTFLDYIKAALGLKIMEKKSKGRRSVPAKTNPKDEEALTKLQIKLKELEHEYELARMGMAKGTTATITAVVGVLVTMSMAFGLKYSSDRELLSGTHIVIIILIVVFGLIAFSSLVFGRAARLRAQISETKKEIELITGDKVR